MRQGTGQSLRTALCLSNPSGMQAARWMSSDTGQSLRTVLCLSNRSGLQAATWRAAPV